MALYFSGVCFEFVISLGSIYRRLLCHWATDSQCEPLCSHPDSLSGTWLCCLTGHYSFPSEVSVGLWARQLRGKLYSSLWQGICSRKAKHFNQVFTGWVPAFSWESGGLLWVRPWLVHYWRWVHSCLVHALISIVVGGMFLRSLLCGFPCPKRPSLQAWVHPSTMCSGSLCLVNIIVFQKYLLNVFIVLVAIPGVSQRAHLGWRC